MREITMNQQTEKSFSEVFHMFETSQSAKGVSEITLRNYKYHLSNISKYLDIQKPFEEITKRDVEAMIVAMRKKGLANNTIATYTRILKTFYNWCYEENFHYIKVPVVREKETVKETYTDEELALLLKRPDKHCDFGEFRCWVIVNFLLNSGCRAAPPTPHQNTNLVAVRQHIESSGISSAKRISKIPKGFISRHQ